MSDDTKWYQYTAVLKNCKPEISMEEFLYGLCEAIDMTPVKHMVHVWPSAGGDIPRFIPGDTGVLIIETSHIIVHWCSELKIAVVEVFSCKPFKAEDVNNYCFLAYNGILDQYEYIHYNMEGKDESV